MRLIIRYCLPGGNINTQVLEIDSSATVDELLGMIAYKFNIPKHHQILKLEEDGIPLVLIPDCLLNQYGIDDKTIVYLEHADPSDEDIAQLSSKKARDPNGYGVFDDFEGHNGVEKANKAQQPRAINKAEAAQTNFTNEVFSDGGFGSDEDSFSKKHENSGLARVSNKLKDERRRLIKEIKANNLSAVQSILKSMEDTDADKEDTSSASSRSHVKKILNGKGQSGWNALQWAVYLGHTEIVQELLNRGAKVNVETKDGWTALQLAIYKEYNDLAEMILKRRDVDVNQVSDKGTALHVAAKHGKLNFVSLLLDNGADLRVANKYGVLPYELASIEPVRRLIEFAMVKRTGEEFCPPKPPIVKGYMFKKGNYLLLLNKRYFVMNPIEGNFIRYKRKEDCPDKPREVIPLKDISGVRRMQPGVLYDKQFHYFHILYRKREILACVNDDVANQWVTYLIQGAVYATYVENRLQAANGENSNNQLLGLDQQSEVIELIDSPKPQSLQPGDVPHPDKESFAFEKRTEPLEPLAEVNNSVEESKLDMSYRRETVAESFNGPESLVALDDDEPEDAVCFQSFEILKILGSGAFGKVYKVKKKSNGKIYAMKALRKRNLILKNHLKYAITEANVLKKANHPFLLGLHYAFQTPLHLYLVLDYCPGRDLAAHLTQRGTFSEEDTRFYIAELILSVEYLHSLDVIYRDLKPENILLDEQGHIKLADFGLSKEQIGDDDYARSFCGSPAYLSPEMLRTRAVGKLADIYGIGTVMYELLSGKSPYYSDDIPSMYHNIKKAKLQMPKNISDKAKNLISKLLNRDPMKRPVFKGKTDIKKDPFFQGLDWEKLKRKEIRPPQFIEIQEDDMEVPTSEVLFYDSDYSENNRYTNRVKNFSFARRGLN